jgi:hypothetical protein
VLDTRRIFVKRLAGVTGSMLLLQDPPIPHPRRRTEVDPPLGEEKQEHAGEQGPATVQQLRLRQQERAFRQTIDRLYTRVGALKTQVDTLQSSQVFSVSVFKEAQKIEKLAKQLKNYAKA